MGSIRFGVVLSPTSGVDTPPSRQVAEHRDVLQLARDMGFDVVFVGQHFGAPGLRFLQPVPYLASLAGVTGDMRLATGVLLLPLLHPLAVAEEMATLDAIGGGRAVLGVGIGYAAREFGVFGVDRSRRTQRFEESIALIRRLWSGESVTHRSDWFDFDGVASSTLPVAGRQIPIWLGGHAAAAVERAARLGDAWYAPPFPTHRELIDLHRTYRDARRNAGARPPEELLVRRDIFLADSVEEARRLARATTGGRYDTYRDWGLDVGDGFSGEDWLDSRYVLGEPDAVVDQLLRIIDAVPMSHLVVKSHWPGQSHKEAMAHFERLGTDVLPRLEAATREGTRTR